MLHKRGSSQGQGFQPEIESPDLFCRLEKEPIGRQHTWIKNRILIVDDNAHVRKALSAYLSTLGWLVVLCEGDIVFWPLYALAEYLLATEDASILDVVVPFFDAAGAEHAERSTVWGHVERALAVIAARVIPGTHLEAYGHGDWNDSLQPADPAMRERLCSTWTVTLHHETLATLAAALRAVHRADDAAPLEAFAAAVHTDFTQRLLADGELPGFAYFHDDGRVDYLLHPRDHATGIHHRLLPMIHAILAD